MVATDQNIKDLEKLVEQKSIMLNTLYDDMANLMKIQSNELLKRDQEIAKLNKRIKYLEKIIIKQKKQSLASLFHKLFE